MDWLIEKVGIEQLLCHDHFMACCPSF